MWLERRLSPRFRRPSSRSPPFHLQVRSFDRSDTRYSDVSGCEHFTCLVFRPNGTDNEDFEGVLAVVDLVGRWRRSTTRIRTKTTMEVRQGPKLAKRLFQSHSPSGNLRNRRSNPSPSLTRKSVSCHDSKAVRIDLYILWSIIDRDWNP